MNDKNIEKSCVMEAPAAPARAHNAGDGAVGAGPGGRFSAQRKLAVVQRLLRGEALEMVSRELNVPAHRLSQWRDRVLDAGMSARKEQERDARDDEIARLKAKIGDITMANELLYAKIDKLEAGRPLARRRSRTCASQPRPSETGSTERRSSAAPGRFHAPLSIVMGLRLAPIQMSHDHPSGAGLSALAPIRICLFISKQRSKPVPFRAKGTARSGPGFGTKASVWRRGRCGGS